MLLEFICILLTTAFESICFSGQNDEMCVQEQQEQIAYLLKLLNIQTAYLYKFKIGQVAYLRKVNETQPAYLRNLYAEILELLEEFNIKTVENFNRVLRERDLYLWGICQPPLSPMMPI